MANTYNTHGFVSGMKLSGTAMAEIDTQVKENANNIDVLTDRMDAVMYERQEEIRSLTIVSDEQSLMLYYHNELLGEITLPGDLDSIIRCTALSVNSNSIDVFVGGSPVNIVATIQPSDCNQHLKFLTGDVRKCTVTSGGAVTGLSVADVPVTVKCGSMVQTVTAHIKKVVSLVDHVSLTTWVQVAEEGRTHPGQMLTSMQYQYTGDLKFFSNAPFDLSKFVLHPGEKMTVTLTGGLSLRRAYVVKAASQEMPPTLYDLTEDYDVLYLTPVILVQQIDGAVDYTTLSFSYSNNLTEDVWIGFFCDVRGTLTPADAIESPDDYASIVISAADPVVSGS